MDRSKSIYVVLSDTGTWFTRLIRAYTRVSHNHVSLAFDAACTEVYSFGRKSPGNPFSAGFVQEDFQGDLFHQAACRVYRCVVNESQHARIRQEIERFAAEKDTYKYNLLGLFGVVLNRPVKRRRAYFCSQFVSYVFEQAGVPLTVKPSALTTPRDLAVSPHLQLIFEGSFPLRASCWQLNSELPFGARMTP